MAGAEQSTFEQDVMHLCNHDHDGMQTRDCESTQESGDGCEADHHIEASVKEEEDDTVPMQSSSQDAHSLHGVDRNMLRRQVRKAETSRVHVRRTTCC